MKTCKNCGKEVLGVPGRRPKEYCNDTCRNQYWKKNAAPKPVAEAATIEASFEEKLKGLLDSKEAKAEREKVMANLELWGWAAYKNEGAKVVAFDPSQSSIVAIIEKRIAQIKAETKPAMIPSEKFEAHKNTRINELNELLKQLK